MKATSAVMLVVIGLILGLMLAFVLQHAGHSNEPLTTAPSASTPTAATVVPAPPVTTMVPATPPVLQAVRVYPCADPTNICDHLKDVGCAVHSWCRDVIGKLGEDVCLKLYEAKSASQVESIGVRCNP